MEVKVRLVLKKQAQHLTDYSSTLAAESFLAPTAGIKPYTDTSNIAAEAMLQANTYDDASVRMTKSHRLEMTMDLESAQRRFQTPLSVAKIQDQSDQNVLGTESQESYVTSSNSLQIPEELQDQVAFAYLPTPPTLFAPRYIPPKTSLHHLTLDTVRGTLGASRCHRRGWTGKNVHVAMVDSGFAPHPFFTLNGFNYTAVPTPQQPNPHKDLSGHGSGEAGNIFAMAPDVEFSGIRQGNSAAEDLESAIATGAKILTNSWGWNWDRMSWGELKQRQPNLYWEFQDISEIISEATQNGVIFIFSAGNGHRAFPGSHPDVISAGGVTVTPDSSLTASSYASSFVSSLYPNRIVPDLCGIVGESSQTKPLKGHIMLPVPNGADLEGENLPQSKSDWGWGIFSGTSAAAPQLAGAVALIQNARASTGKPPLTASQVKSILQSSATDVINGVSAMGDAADIGFDFATGSGLVNSFDACIAATNY